MVAPLDNADNLRDNRAMSRLAARIVELEEELERVHQHWGLLKHTRWLLVLAIPVGMIWSLLYAALFAAVVVLVFSTGWYLTTMHRHDFESQLEECQRQLEAGDP